MEEIYNRKIIKEFCLANPYLTNKEIAKLYNEKLKTSYDLENLRKVIGIIKKKFHLENPLKKSSLNIEGDEASCTKNIDASDERYKRKETKDSIEEDFVVCDKIITCLDEALAFSRVDLSVWEIKDHLFNTWTTSRACDESPNGFQQINNVNVKIWFKKKDIEKENSWKNFTEKLENYAPDYDKFLNEIKKPYSKGKTHLLELSLCDLHLGKLAWSEETGENYKIKEAIKRYKEAVNNLLSKVNLNLVERILLPIGNDMINIDNKQLTTTAGTPQVCDSRWQEMFMKAKELLIETIDKLSLIAPVDVLVVSGNHDSTTMFYLGDSLESWYRKNSRVIIDNAPTQRKYIQYGTNLLGFTHGNEEKHADLGMIMATEKPLLWADTKYREFHLGHFHKTKSLKYVDVDEYQGFKIRVLPSLSAIDSWHNSKGYNSIKAATAFLYEKEEGLVANYQYNLI